MARSQTPTNSGKYLSTTPTGAPERSLNRASIDASIKEFTKMWAPSQPAPTDKTKAADAENNNGDYLNTIASTNSESLKLAHMKRNGVLKSGGVPLPPLSLEIDPNAWDLPPSGTKSEYLRRFELLRKGNVWPMPRICQIIASRALLFITVHVQCTLHTDTCANNTVITLFSDFLCIGMRETEKHQKPRIDHTLAFPHLLPRHVEYCSIYG